MEKTAYAILLIVAIILILLMTIGLIAAFPWGLLGLAAVLAIGLLFYKALHERLTNEEDDHYSKNVEQ